MNLCRDWYGHDPCSSHEPREEAIHVRFISKFCVRFYANDQNKKQNKRFEADTKIGSGP